MATRWGARNATFIELLKPARTNFEPLPQIFAEYFCVSGSYGGSDFFEEFFEPARIAFGAIFRADNRHGSTVA